jgi:hypothetical protein
MGKNRIFFPQHALDMWLADARVELEGNVLTIKSEGRRYRVVEAVRVLGEVTGTVDSSDLVGTVKTVAFVTELGAELLESSMLIGDNAYDVVPGWVGSPIGAFAERRAPDSDEREEPAQQRPENDEELLVQFLMRNL